MARSPSVTESIVEPAGIEEATSNWTRVAPTGSAVRHTDETSRPHAIAERATAIFKEGVVLCRVQNHALGLPPTKRAGGYKCRGQKE